MSILSGLRVLEFAEGWCGAAITGRLLAELGATVIKVELPEGDPLRRGQLGADGVSLAFDLLAAGKSSLALDYLGSPEAIATVREVAETCDVVIDGLEPGTLDTRGLGAASVRRVNPDAIWCDVSIFGRDAPLSRMRGGDLAAQAMSGFMATTGFADDVPTSAGLPLGEYAAAAFAITAVLASLFHRDRTGEAQDIDIAAVDCLAYFLSSFLPAVFVGGPLPTRQGFRHPLMAPWDVFAATDGKVVICSGNNAHWHAILRLVGCADLIASERYATPERRVVHVEEVNALIQNWIGTLRADDAIAQLHGIGIPAGPILDLEQVLAHPHFRARGMMRELDDGMRKSVTPGSVYRMSRTPGGVERPAPAVGADNATFAPGFHAHAPGHAA